LHATRARAAHARSARGGRWAALGGAGRALGGR
jgi:hypothetical protein